MKHFFYLRCCEVFTKYQVETIEENKRLFDNLTPQMKQHVQQVRECCAISYQQRFNVKRLDTQRYVVPQFETVFVLRVFFYQCLN